MIIHINIAGKKSVHLWQFRTVRTPIPQVCFMTGWWFYEWQVVVTVIGDWYRWIQTRLWTSSCMRGWPNWSSSVTKLVVISLGLGRFGMRYALEVCVLWVYFTSWEFHRLSSEDVTNICDAIKRNETYVGHYQILDL